MAGGVVDLLQLGFVLCLIAAPAFLTALALTRYRDGAAYYALVFGALGILTSTMGPLDSVLNSPEESGSAVGIAKFTGLHAALFFLFHYFLVVDDGGARLRAQLAAEAPPRARVAQFTPRASGGNGAGDGGKRRGKRSRAK